MWMMLEDHLDLKLLQKGLAGAGFAAFFVSWLSMVPWHLPSKIPLVETPALSFTASESLTPLAELEAALDQSVLFGAREDNAGLSVLKSSINELVKDCRLKGVVIMGEPEAILVDARSDKSVFVRVGDQIGELTVLRIGDGSIVLGYFGEEKEVRVS